MVRSQLVTVLLAVSALAGGVRVFQLSKQVSDLGSQNQDLEARYENLQSELLDAHSRDQTERMGRKSSADELQSRVVAQQVIVNQAQQRLNKQRDDGQAGTHLGGLKDKLREEDQLIADLAQQLKDARARDSQLRGQDKYYQQQAGANKRQNDQDLKAQIFQQQQILQELTTQLKHFKVNPWDSDSTDQYGMLQAKVAAQKSAIQQLKEQRGQSSAEWGYQKAETHAQSQQGLSDLKSSEEEIRSQLQREKSAQASLQRDIQSGFQTQSSQKALLESAQADYETQKAKLQDLQNQLRAARQELQELGDGK